MIYKILFALIIAIALALIIAALVYINREKRAHQQDAIYIMDRKTGLIHLKGCQKAQDLPSRQKEYLNEWQYRSHRDQSKAVLKYCRLCINLK